MDTFRLVVAAIKRSETDEIIEYQAPDAGSALIFARDKARDRPVELWRGGGKLCTITASKEFWVIS